MSVDSQGTRHLVWVGGFGAGGNLIYAELPLGASDVNEQTLALGAADFFDPPHITVAPNNDVWIVFGDDSAAGGEDVKLLRKRFGQTSFDPPFAIAFGAGRQYSADAEVDGDGIVHLVWLDERTQTHVHYGRFDPSIPAMIETFQLTEVTGNWIRPTLALDVEGDVYVLWEDNVSVTAGDLWFTTTARYRPSSVEGWEHYR